MSMTVTEQLPRTHARKPTMACIRDRVAADLDPTLPLRKRKDMVWAIGAVCKALQISLDAPADPRVISERLTGFAPATANLAPTTWKNALALVRFAFRRTGVMKSPARRTVRFAPAWTAAMKLPRLKNQMIGLSRLARFCSHQGIDPEAVDDAVFAAFLEDMENNQVLRNARKVHRRAAQIWNELANSTPGWPNQTVTVPTYSKTYALPWESFPPSLKADVEAHLAVLSGADPLADLDVKPLKPSSIRTRRHQLHILISGMVLSGEPASRFETLADVVALSMVQKGLRFLLARVASGSTAQAHDVSRTIVSVAKHWVKVPADHLAKLQAFCKRLDTGGGGLTKQNRDRLRQFDDPRAVAKLLNLPSRLVVQARRWEDKPSQADALRVQTALAIELLLMLPMRRHNLTGLQIDKHFVRNRDGAVYLMIDGAEVKNGIDIDAQLPPEAVKLLDLYLKVYRPALVEGSSPWLFPGVGGRSKSRERLALQVSDTIKHETGLLVHMHLFRHIAAKLYLDQHPGAYGVVQRLCGHKSINTTIGTYCGMERRSAVAHYDKTILNLRKGKAA